MTDALRPAADVRAEMDELNTPEPPFYVAALAKSIERHKRRGWVLFSARPDQFEQVRSYIKDQGYTVAPVTGSISTADNVVSFGDFMGFDAKGVPHWNKANKEVTSEKTMFRVSW